MNGAVYDATMAPLERGGLAARRRRAWAEVPNAGFGLELGAGTGANLGFHPPNARVVSTDVSPGMLRRAREKAGLRVCFVACDAQRLPFRDSAFDWVAETLVFCQVPDPSAALREVARVLPPGAPLVMLEHVRPRGILGVAADWVSRFTVPLFGEHFDRSPELDLERAGFRVRRAFSMWRGVFRLLVCSAPIAA